MGARTSIPVVQLPKERIVIVTGANSGLGYEIAKWTAMMGATVIMACRSQQRALEAIEKMKAEFLEEKSRGTEGLTEGDLNLIYMELDCASYKSVLQFVDNFKKSGRPLHVLFCNAGLGLCPFAKTEDGLEQVLQVNYMSQWLLTAKLLPIMKNSGPDCRVLFMSSSFHEYGRLDMATINYEGRPRDFPVNDYYCRSKLYQIMQMYSMCERLKGSDVTVNAVNPGSVRTQFAADTPICKWWCILKCIRCCRIARDVRTGAKCSIDCVVNPTLCGVTGVYFDDGDQATPSLTARNHNNQEQLWRYTKEELEGYLTPEEINCMEGR